MAKKKYYQGKKDRMDERRGMERRDAGMISEDRSAIANLPQDVKYHDWPQAPYAERTGLNDNIKGIDEQMWDDTHGKSYKRGKYPEKY